MISWMFGMLAVEKDVGLIGREESESTGDRVKTPQ